MFDIESKRFHKGAPVARASLPGPVANPSSTRALNEGLPIILFSGQSAALI
ncbi:hypothetical protein [Burkholderia pyrrocinia]|uniref:hypothetical protein n=1 Tax=Burkholderia pyrrocinia TaxID=60550 RepID=UPI001F46EFE6|nr:hypothetical protein [Burkholderia pyrrocinia]